MADQLQLIQYDAATVGPLLDNPACHVREKHAGDGRHRPEVPTGASGMSSAFAQEAQVIEILEDALNSTEGQNAIRELTTTQKPRREQTFSIQVSYSTDMNSQQIITFLFYKVPTR